MTTIIKYKTEDGQEFDDSEKARAHEATYSRFAEILRPLGPHSATSEGWVQHNPDTVKRVWIAVVTASAPLVKGFDKLYAACLNDPASVHPSGLWGRVISDSGRSPARDAQWRFSCIDDKGREHNQPYFAYNGPDSDHVCIEDRSKN